MAGKSARVNSRREMYGHDDGTVWELVQRDRKRVTLRNVFNGISRRPTVQTFSRDYRLVSAPRKVI